MSSSSQAKKIDRALEIRREILHEIKHGTLSRREMYRKMLFAGGALAALSQLRGNSAWAQAGGPNATTTSSPIPAGPPTTPFVEEMPHVNRPAYIKQAEALTPAPTREANTGAGGLAECRRAPHQLWNTHWANLTSKQRRTYVMRQQLVSAPIHRELPPQQFFTFDGKLPGPTFHSRYGTPCIVRIINELPAISAHRGYGNPETSTHLHNGHVPSESDGFPDDYYPRNAELNPASNDPGRFRDYHYPNMYAGNDPREALGTLWYHDHRHDYTSHNVYRGLAGFHLMFDEVDSGNETDRNLRALKLPSGEYDVPLAVTDRFVGSDGIIQFDQFNFDGIIGNKYLVNGKVQPFFRVENRKYRLRILNASVSRVYGFALYTSDSPNGPVDATPLPAHIIAHGGNLLPAPIPLRNPTPLGGAGRLDLIVDFSKVPLGKYVYLVNRWTQNNGREPDGYLGSGPDGIMFSTMPGAGDAVMRFDVVLPSKGDPSQMPAKLRDLPWDPNDALGQLSEVDILNAVDRARPFPGVERVRQFKFDRTNGMWSVNGSLYDGSRPVATVGKDTGEIWILEGAGSWVHPVHLHQEEHRTLYRSGRKPGPQHLEYGRDDTMALGGGERGIMFRKFRDFTGKYVMHCHNTVHEDHAMMVRWDIA